MGGWRIAKIVGVLAIVGIGYAAFKDDIAKAWQDLHVTLVEHPTPKKTVWLDQGIPKEKLSWFYHADQGTRTFGFPYEWLMALEQPTIPWLLFTDADCVADRRWLHAIRPLEHAQAELAVGSRLASAVRHRAGG